MNFTIKKWGLLLATIAMIGCSPKEDTSTIPAPEPTPEPVNKTTVVHKGKVTVSDLVPEGWGRNLEIVIVEKINEDIEIGIHRQNKSLETVAAALAPKEEEALQKTTSETSAQTTLQLSERDVEMLNKQLADLMEEVPRPIKSDVSVGSSLREFESRQSLYERYMRMAEKIQLADLESTINAVTELMKQDYAFLQKESERNDSSGYQAIADINWLAAFSEHFEQYQRVVWRYDALRRRAAYKNQYQRRSESPSQTATDTRTPLEILRAYLFNDGQDTQLAVFKNVLNSVPVEDGTEFKIEGDGVLLIQFIHKDGSLFFESGKENDWVTVEGLTREAHEITSTH